MNAKQVCHFDGGFGVDRVLPALVHADRSPRDIEQTRQGALVRCVVVSCHLGKPIGNGLHTCMVLVVGVFVQFA